MSDLVDLCRGAGFSGVETYIASGNVVFESKAAASKVKATLEACLQAHAGKPTGVILRSASAMQAVLAANPFGQADPKLTYAIFLDAPPPADALSHARGRNDEDMRLGRLEIYVHYPSGMGRSRLTIPAAKTGTARNMNTVAKLVEIASR